MIPQIIIDYITLAKKVVRGHHGKLVSYINIHMIKQYDLKIGMGLFLRNMGEPYSASFGAKKYSRSANSSKV